MPEGVTEDHRHVLARETGMAEGDVAEAHRHIRWQVRIDDTLSVWVNLPAFMTPILDRYYLELERRPIVFAPYWMFEYRVHPVLTQTNRVTDTVRPMQRVVLLRIA